MRPNGMVILTERWNWWTTMNRIKKMEWKIIDCCVTIKCHLVINVPVLTSCHHSDYKKTALPKRQWNGALYWPQVGSSKCHSSQDWIPLFLQEWLQALNEHWIQIRHKRDRKSQFAAKFKPSVWQDHMHFIPSLFMTSLKYKKSHFLTLPMISSISLACFPQGTPVKVTHETTPYFHTFYV